MATTITRTATIAPRDLKTRFNMCLDQLGNVIYGYDAGMSRGGCKNLVL